MENENIEETQNASTEDVNNEEQNGQEETTDWKAEALKAKAILQRKEKKLQELLSLRMYQHIGIIIGCS